MLGIDQHLIFRAFYGRLPSNAQGKRYALLAAALLCLQLIWAFPGVAHAQQAEIVDLDTQRRGMHACPEGMFVVGVHVSKNALLCSNAVGSYRIAYETIDSATERNHMHACPPGYAVTGLHVDKNWLLCARLTIYAPIEYVDGDNESPHQRKGMHACPVGYALVGIHAGKNDFLCGKRP